MLQKLAMDKSTMERFTMDPARKSELLRIGRRLAIIAIPAIGLTIFAGLLVWSVRRQLDALGEGLVVEPTEPISDVGSEVIPA